MQDSITRTNHVATLSFITDGGQMGEYIRNYDWINSPLGEPSKWPESLKTAINIALNSDIAMYVAWGEQFTHFYNDAFQALLGSDNTPIIGESSDEAFENSWHIIGPAFQQVLSGNPVRLNDLPIEVSKHGVKSQRYFNVALSPIAGERGTPGGIFATVTKSTERQLKNLIRQAPVGIVKYRSADFIIELANDQALAMWGKKFEEVHGKPIKEIFPEIEEHPALKAAHEISVQKMLNGETYVVSEQELTFTRNGKLEVGYFNYTHEPIRDAQGKVTGVLAVAVEVTEQVEARRRVEAVGKELVNLAHAMPQLVWIANPDGKVTFYNDRIERFAGAKKLPDGNWSWEGLMHPDDLDDTYLRWNNAVTNGTVYEKEHRVLMKNGEHRWHLSRAIPILDASGKLVKWYGTATDIHEIRTSQKQIQESEERLRQANDALEQTTRSLLQERERLEIALRTGQLGVYEWKIGEPIVWWSPETYAVFGVDPKTFRPTTEAFNAIIHPDDREQLWRKTQASIESREVFVHEYRILCPDGSIRWIANRSNIGVDPDGNVERITGVAADITDRKEAELTRAQLSAIVESSADAIYSYDFDGILLSWNNSAELLYGYAAHEIVGQNIELLIPDERRGEAMKMIIPSIINGQLIRNLETVRRKRDGSVFDALMTASPIRDNQGNIIAISIIVRDITETKAAEQRVRYAAALTNNIADAVIATDKSDYKIISWNKGAELLYGWKAEEVIGKPARSIIPTTPITGQTADWLTSLQRSNYWRGEVIQFNKKGQQLFIQSSLAAVENEKGDVTSFVAVNRDVTLVKQIEEELKKAKEQLEITFANIPSAIYRFDKQGVLEYLNQRGAEMLGFSSPADATRLSISDMNAHIDQRFIRMHEDGSPYRLERGSVYKAFVNAQRAEAVIQMIDRTTLASQWILTSSTPVFDEDGKVSFVLTVATNITNQKVAEESLRKSEESLEKLVVERTRELQRSNEDLQQFAHVASHDLKEPIRKIKTFASRLETEKAELLDEKGKLFLSKIQSAGERMLKMVEGVLNYSIIGALGEADFEQVDLNRVMQDIENDLEVLMQAKQAKLIYASLPYVKGVPIRIYQLFYNLIINSVKFARSGIAPEIKIESSLVEKDGKKMSRIIFSDNGIGFESQQASIIFDTFTRLHSLDKYEGTGLGLALCKKIVERHGGTIQADGVVNQGATFTIHLPQP